MQFWVNSHTEKLLSADVINVLSVYFMSFLFVYLFRNQIEIKSLSSDEAAIQDLSDTCQACWSRDCLSFNPWMFLFHTEAF